MFSKTAFLTGAAVLMLGAAPALAQDPAPDAMAPAPATQTPPAPEGSMQIQPGSDVKGSDGTVLGKLEGVQAVEGVQQLKVRGSDGVLKGVPLTGLKRDGAGIAVAWTTAEFQAAPALADPASPAPAAAPTETPPSATPPNG